MRRWFRFGPTASLAGFLMLACSPDKSASSVPPVDSGGDGPSDPGADANADTNVAHDVSPDTGVTPLCPEGSWGNIPSTECDLLGQDCANKLLTCYPNVQGGTPGSSCVTVGYGAKTRGMPCDRASDCASGLVCAAKYCTPFCCAEHQHQICGTGGRCDIHFSIATGSWVMICSYSQPCTLWMDDCPSGEACQPVAEDGSASCTAPAAQSFKGEGEPCTARNDCGNDQGCVTLGTSPAVCRYYCKLADSPWDAGSPDGGPGGGGCPEGQDCRPLQDAPIWLGACGP
ncbi:MAG: hypothetical protein MUF54_00750 [Polyangiaceae bacterium]|jgi:hypothetical protein|nr:hypothetical protein [Polyangiaceae bacterium]